MTIKDKLKTIAYKDDSAFIKFSEIDFKIFPTDKFEVYKTVEDFNNKFSLISIDLGDIKSIDQSILDEDFSVFHLYRPNQLYSQISLAFILKPYKLLDKGANMKMRYL